MDKLGRTISEKMVGAWIGNEASFVETTLPQETGLLDLAQLVASRVLRGVAAGADRFYFELAGDARELWECVNGTASIGVLSEPDPGVTLAALWDAHDSLHDEHRMVPDTPSWLMVSGDREKARIAVRFEEEDPISGLAEVVSAGVYHLVLNGARSVLVEVARDSCLVMTRDSVAQASIEKTFDEVETPVNTPVGSLTAGV